MTTQAGPEEDRRPDRPTLLKEFRGILVEQYPTVPSMNTVIGDTGLEPPKFVTSAEEPDHRWSEALRRVDRAGKLIKFIDVVRQDFPSDQPQIIALYQFEKKRLKDERTPADRLRDSLKFTRSYTLQLQDAEHLDQQSIAVLQNQIKGLFRALNDLLDNPGSGQGQNLGMTYLTQIRQRAEKCIDILQYYKDLLILAEQSDEFQDGSAGRPGDLGAHARDRRVLLQGKAALRNSLARLAEYLKRDG
jgi:hypothetical protein